MRAGIIVLVGLLTYANALSGPFFLDDLETVTVNDSIQHLWPPSAVLFPARELPVAGRPVVNLSFALNYAAGGFDVGGYHAVNIALHILCALVLFGVVRRTLTQPAFAARVGARATDLAFAVGLIWLVHPLQTEAVDYVTERTELMMGLFFLLTLYASIRAYDERRGARRAEVPDGRSFAVGCCLLGMGCKETMAMAPLLVALYDRVFLYESFAAAWKRRRGLYVALAATWVVLVALSWSGPRSRSAGFGSGVSPWLYLLNQAELIVRYLRLTVWPSGLVIMYGNVRALTLADVWPQALLLVALVAAVAVALRLWPAIGFLGAWFFVTLAPTSSFVPIATEVGAERRMYLPLAAIVTLAVVAVAMLPTKRRPRDGVAGFAVLAVVVSILATLSALRNSDYTSAVTLAETVMSRWPTARAQHWLGAELLAAGRHDEGLTQLRAALPGDPRVHYTLGMTLYRDGNLPDAVSELQAFVAVEPLRIEVPEARETIGRALDREGKFEEALTEFHAVLSMTPSNVVMHGLLGDTLLKEQKFDAAIAEYQTFLRQLPTNVDALTNLGIAYASSGKADAAVDAFGRAVQANPNQPGARRNFARALIEAGRFADALPQAQAAVGLMPNDPVAHDELGLALAGVRRYAEATAEFQRSLQLDPSDAEVQGHLAAAVRGKDAIIAHP